jgi:hypothetical protein
MDWTEGLGLSGASDERRAAASRSRRPRAPAGDLLQLALNGAGTRKEAPIHLLELIVGCAEHEPTGDTDGNADRAVVILDRKTLHDHWTLLPASSGTRRVIAADAAARFLNEGDAHR